MKPTSHASIHLLSQIGQHGAKAQNTYKDEVEACLFHFAQNAILHSASLAKEYTRLRYMLPDVAFPQPASPSSQQQIARSDVSPCTPTNLIQPCILPVLLEPHLVIYSRRMWPCATTPQALFLHCRDVQKRNRPLQPLFHLCGHSRAVAYDLPRSCRRCAAFVGQDECQPEPELRLG